MKLETFKDKRGMIKDLLVGKDFSVTYITFKKGAVRGNHVHKKTEQIDILLSGSIYCKKGEHANMQFKIEKGSPVWHDKGEPHAYKSLKDSEMISICFGKRIGKNYSKDTYALQEPLIEPSR